ncbi:hypothetical protein ACXET9_02655 [Brachybacterium sp. DNPG3]
MSQTRTARQGTQIIADGLRIGVIGAGLAEGEPAARLALRDSSATLDVLLRLGEHAQTARTRVTLLDAQDDPEVPGTGTVQLLIEDVAP